MVNFNSVDSKILHIGFDDTDSPHGRCTTNLAFKISCKLKAETDSIFVDYPLLVRLNPNIPWKTRGNGGVCLRLKTNQPNQVIEYLINAIRSESDIKNGASPALAVFAEDEVPLAMRQFSNRAMYDVIEMKEAENLSTQFSIQTFKFGEGLGLIGAIASIGCLLEGDHTYEAIAYRKQFFQGLPRKIDKSKVEKISINTHPFTFNNFDRYHDRVLITPHGPDPVFCGIRGEDPFTVIRALNYVLPQEKLDGYMVFRTNQGTNMHIQNDLSAKNLGPYKSGYIRCSVWQRPKIIKGGHVFFEVLDFSNNKYLVAVYEPTGLGNIASKLIEGDILDIGFGVSKKNSHPSAILNVEYLSILRSVDVLLQINPMCKKCGKRMKSEGRNKGFQCKICGDKENSKVDVTKPRDILLGIYLPDLKAHRHLTKPLHRFGLEKTYPYIPNVDKPLHVDWLKIF